MRDDGLLIDCILWLIDWWFFKCALLFTALSFMCSVSLVKTGLYFYIIACWVITLLSREVGRCACWSWDMLLLGRPLWEFGWPSWYYSRLGNRDVGWYGLRTSSSWALLLSIIELLQRGEGCLTAVRIPCALSINHFCPRNSCVFCSSGTSDPLE